MSLRAFHIAFIVISSLLSAGFAAWCFANAAPENSYRLMGTASAAAFPALILYLYFFVRKTRPAGGTK